MEKKNYFCQNTINEILKKEFVPFEEIGLENLENLAFSNNYTILPEPISEDEEIQKKFIKHGPELKLKRAYSISESLKREKSQEIGDAFDNIKQIPSCYSFKPYWGLDQRNRRVHLVDCVKGAKLYAYSQNSEEKIEIFPYDSSKKVEKEGAQVLLKVPSTTKGISPHEFQFSFVPIINNSFKKEISLQLLSDHVCGYKRFRELKYDFSNSPQFSKTNDFCFHEIAGYFSIIDYFSSRKNNVPFEENNFVIPTLSTAKFNVSLENNVLLSHKGEKGQEYRKIKFADKEILNWRRVKSLGYEKTFFSRKSRDGNLRDYVWQ